jgi:hypothetical protein
MLYSGWRALLVYYKDVSCTSSQQRIYSTASCLVRYMVIIVPRIRMAAWIDGFLTWCGMEWYSALGIETSSLWGPLLVQSMDGYMAASVMMSWSIMLPQCFSVLLCDIFPQDLLYHLQSMILLVICFPTTASISPCLVILPVQVCVIAYWHVPLQKHLHAWLLWVDGPRNLVDPHSSYAHSPLCLVVSFISLNSVSRSFAIYHQIISSSSYTSPHALYLICRVNKPTRITEYADPTFSYGSDPGKWLYRAPVLLRN